MTPRALRVLYLANDGASAGHVTRSLAVARALVRAAAARGVPVQSLLATTSAADRLLAWAGVPAVRVPDPRGAARAGWTEGARRLLAAKVIEGAVDAFAPDVLVTDTFPCGPQLEARGVLDRVRWRVLVRRRVDPARAHDAEVSAALDRYHAVLVPDDPGPLPAGSTEAPANAHTVPPITLAMEERPLSQEEARRALGLGMEGRLLLINCGGGGDPDAEAVEERIAEAVRRDGRFVPVVARGPLAGRGADGPRAAIDADRQEAGAPLRVDPVPLAPYLAAFDAAIVAAGYNAAHEVARAGLPAELFARPRAFDDQAARARRFTEAGLAGELASLEPAALAGALDRLAAGAGRSDLAPDLRLAEDGGRAVAAAVLELVGAERARHEGAR